MKNWNTMNYNEKVEATEQMNETFAFTQSYIDAKTAAHEIAECYKTLQLLFEFEV